MKKLAFTRKINQQHWVGDGFPVRTLFSYNDIAHEMSPFLLMDYAGPYQFSPTQQRRGVGEHPHRGFETVTLVYDGEVEHRDSSGGGGLIGPGDVQWMTAASGIIHDEFHGTEYAKKGGPFEVVQLWVNLPRKDKMAAPGYQTLLKSQIPSVELSGAGGLVRVIAGDFYGTRGPAHTFSPMNLWDMRLNAGHVTQFQVPQGHTTAVFVLKGRIQLPDGAVIGEAELGVMERNEEIVQFSALENTILLLLNGKPLNEPIVGYGPFVMNDAAEIRQAFIDFENGKMGQIKPKSQ